MLRRALFNQGTKMSMSTYTTDKASPFTRAVVRSMRKLLVTSREKNATSRGLSIHPSGTLKLWQKVLIILAVSIQY